MGFVHAVGKQLLPIRCCKFSGYIYTMNSDLDWTFALGEGNFSNFQDVLISKIILWLHEEYYLSGVRLKIKLQV